MNFFNIGPGELIFIFVLALLIFGPRRLPELARDLGKTIRSFQEASQQLTGEFTKEMEQATKAMDEANKSVTGPVSELVATAGTELTAARAAVTGGSHPGNAEAAPSPAPSEEAAPVAAAPTPAETVDNEPLPPDDSYMI